MIEQTKKQKILFEIKTMAKEIALILIGTFVLAIGFKIFLTPYKIVPGGFMGLSKIIVDMLAQIGFTTIPVSIWYIILNSFLYIFAVKLMGFKFAIRVGVGIASYSLFVEIVDKLAFLNPIMQELNNEKAYIVYAIFGGIIMGAGIGFVFRGNGSTGGSDLLSVVINKFFPTVTSGQIVMGVDATVVVLSFIAYGEIILPLYALISIFVSGRVIDMFIDGVRSLRAYYVVTDKKEEISKEVMEKLNRGVTNIKGEGMFRHTDVNMLLIIIKRFQVVQFKKIVKTIDPNSFMFSCNIKEAFGKGFITYKNNEHTNKKNKDKKENKEIKDNKQISNNSKYIEIAEIDKASLNVIRSNETNKNLSKNSSEKGLDTKDFIYDNIDIDNGLKNKETSINSNLNSDEIKNLNENSKNKSGNIQNSTNNKKNETNVVPSPRKGQKVRIKGGNEQEQNDKK